MSASPVEENERRKSQTADIPRVEWLVGAVGLMVVMSAIGVLIYEEVAGNKSPPDVKLSVEAITPLRNGYLVKVRAANEGGEPAARVPITVELRSEGEEVETREIQFEYLPAHSIRDAGVFFSADPRQGELRLEASGYEEP